MRLMSFPVFHVSILRGGVLKLPLAPPWVTVPSGHQQGGGTAGYQVLVRRDPQGFTARPPSSTMGSGGNPLRLPRLPASSLLVGVTGSLLSFPSLS